MAGAAPQAHGKRSLDAELNLVPFIDLLCALISFLLMTAVWMQVSTLELRQGSDAAAHPPVDLVDTRLVFDTHGITYFENNVAYAQIPLLAGAYDYPQLEDKLREAHDRLPTQKNMAITLGDSVAYNDMIRAMDACVGAGFVGISLSGTAL